MKKWCIVFCFYIFGEGMGLWLQKWGLGGCLFFIFAHMLTVNGQSVDAAGKTVAEYLAEAGYNTVRIAVERNEEIVPKTKYAETVLADGDVVEVVNFVGGG